MRRGRWQLIVAKAFKANQDFTVLRRPAFREFVGYEGTNPRPETGGEKIGQNLLKILFFFKLHSL